MNLKPLASILRQSRFLCGLPRNWREQYSLWKDLVPEYFTEGQDFRSANVRHVRWMLAFDRDSLAEDFPELVRDYTYVVKYEYNLNEDGPKACPGPVSWAIEEEDSSIHRSVLWTEWGSDTPYRVAALGILIEPSLSRPVVVYKGDGWTKVWVRHVSIHIETQNWALTRNFNPWLVSEKRRYDEVVGFPYYLGLVTPPKPKNSVDRLDVSEELARAVSAYTGVPYLGRLFEEV